MKRFHILPILLLLGALSAGCDAVTGEDEASGTVTLSGQVISDPSGDPVPNALVRVLPYDRVFQTNDEGRFEGSVGVDSTMNLSIIASSTGYGNASVDVLAVPGRALTVPPLRLLTTDQVPTTSGRAHSLTLLDQSASSIGVKEAGGEEVMSLTFQLVDSVGRPVVLDHSAVVQFSLGARPNGGETIFPASASTNNNGQVSVSLTSGTRAGVVQLHAETSVDGRVIRSLPVAVSIHGGLPVLEHFSVGPGKFNFPGMSRYGQRNAVSVYLGDQYGNPVRVETSVYFTTTHGIIGGSTLTDVNGEGEVVLTSAEPLPRVTGVGIITASTADVNENTISKRVPVLFSGESQFNVDPSCFFIGGNCVVTVTDPYGRPLVEGTTIKVTVEGENVVGTGSVNIIVPETAFNVDPNGDDNWSDTEALVGSGRTQWHFGIRQEALVDDEGQPLTARLDAVTIAVNGPNGTFQESWGLGAAGKTAGARTHALRIQEADGSVTVRYKE